MIGKHGSLSWKPLLLREMKSLIVSDTWNREISIDPNDHWKRLQLKIGDVVSVSWGGKQILFIFDYNSDKGIIRAYNLLSKTYDKFHKTSPVATTMTVLIRT